MVGTSAGALVGGLSAAGVPPWFMVAHSAGETIPTVADAAGDEQTRSGGMAFRPHRGLPAILAGWLPRGLVTEPLKRTMRAAAGEGWPPILTSG
jgi:hypothetical protein